MTKKPCLPVNFEAWNAAWPETGNQALERLLNLSLSPNPAPGFTDSYAT